MTRAAVSILMIFALLYHSSFAQEDPAEGQVIMVNPRIDDLKTEPIRSKKTKGPYILSVDQLRELRPGPSWDPDVEEVLISVRGYLRSNANLYLHESIDMALLDDIGGVLVSDEGEGKLRRNCSEGYVELTGRITWQELEQHTALVPTEAKRLTLRKHARAEEKICWKAD